MVHAVKVLLSAALKAQGKDEYKDEVFDPASAMIQGTRMHSRACMHGSDIHT